MSAVGETIRGRRAEASKLTHCRGEMPMPTLTIGKRTYEVSEPRVRGQANRMFKMSQERRNHRVEEAKTRLARLARESQSVGIGAAQKQAAAILLSQGTSEI
jgi:hypothetical protein